MTTDLVERAQKRAEWLRKRMNLGPLSTTPALLDELAGEIKNRRLECIALRERLALVEDGSALRDLQKQLQEVEYERDDAYGSRAALRTEIEQLKRESVRRPDVRERIAAEAHQIWADWMHYMQKHLRPGSQRQERDGTYLVQCWLPRSLIERWCRQMQTRYDGLTLSEKEADKAIADRYIRVILKGTSDES